MKAQERRDSTDSTHSSPLFRPTIDAVVLLLILPLILVVIVLVPWGDLDFSSPHLQLLGIALTFASVLLCLKMACAACPRDSRYVVDDMGSRRCSRQGLLSNAGDFPPNYDSVVGTTLIPGGAAPWVITIQPQSPNHLVSSLSEPPPYYAVVIEGTPELRGSTNAPQ